MDAQEWDARYQEKPLLWSAGPNRFVEEELAELDPGSGLDVACGEGRNAVWLAGRGWDVTGVDFSAVALERARRMAVDRGVDVTWVEADVLEWQPGRHFDLVLVAYVQLPSHLRDGLMHNAVEWVASGGHLFLVGHDVATAGLSGPPNPDLLWTPEVARETVAPLEVIQAERRSRETDTGEAALDTVLLARRPT